MAKETTPLLKENQFSANSKADLGSNNLFPKCEENGETNKSPEKSTQEVPRKSEQKVSDIRPIRTCLIFSLACHVSWTSYNGIQNVQSSINDTANLGVISMAVIYATGFLVAPLCPSVLRIVGAKNLVIFTFSSYIVWTAVNFHPSFETFIPASVLSGASQSLPMLIIGLYMMVVSQSYITRNKLPKERLHNVLSVFNGVYFAFHQFTQVSGNLISSLVLFQSSNLDNATDDATVDVTDMSAVCGAHMCPTTSGNSSDSVIVHPDESTINVLFGVYMACNVVGVLLLIFVPSIPHSAISSGPTKSIKQELRGVISMFVDPRMLLCMPMFMGNAMLIMFIYSGYTKAFVSCPIGVQWVGFIMIAYGVSTSIFSVLTNSLSKFLPRPALIVFFLVTDIAIMTSLLFWDPGHDPPKLVLFGIAAAFGVNMGISQPQFNATVTMVFPENVSTAFVVYNASKVMGYTLSLAVSSFVCLNERLYMIIAFYTAGLVCYVKLEHMLREKVGHRDTALSISGRYDSKESLITQTESDQKRDCGY